MFTMTDFLNECEFRFPSESRWKYAFERVAGVLWIYDLSGNVMMGLHIEGYDDGTLYVKSNAIGYAMAHYSLQILPNEFAQSAIHLNEPRR